MARFQYRLLRGDSDLGVVTYETDDFPQHEGVLQQSSAFESVRSLFEREIKLLETEGATAAWRQLRDEIDGPGVRLEPHEWVGKAIVNPLIHIRGNKVWWR